MKVPQGIDEDFFEIIKLGGNETENPEFLRQFAQTVALQEHPVVIVHGGGKEIASFQERLGIPSRFIDGLRVTDAETMHLVQMVLCGSANKRIVSALLKESVKSVGISGIDAHLMECEAVSKELGFVGRPTRVQPQFVLDLLELDFVPVIAPIAMGPGGKAYNINADWAAAAIARALQAPQLTFLSNVPGVKIQGQVQEKMSKSAALQAMESGDIHGGMIPKVQSALEALDAGLNHVRICDLENFHGGGTLFV